MMLKLQVFTGTTLALLLSAGSGSVLAIENTQTTTQQPTNTQLAHAGDRVTISGIVEDIDDDVVTVRTPDGDTKDLWISEDLQEELGIEIGDAVSGTTHKPNKDVIPVDFVTRREVEEVTIEFTDTTRRRTVTRPAPTTRPTPVSRPVQAQPRPIPGLW
ncbi:MAG: hypothetical protein F6K41_32025 [Symploca sp. SIO3E6]|nr:hypothetical protein [Caldora sp. SIO3E6]